MSKLRFLFFSFLLAALSLIIVKNWYLGEKLIISSDLTFPLRPIFYFTNQLLYQWLPSLNGGISHAVAPSLLFYHGIGAVLNLFLANIVTIQFFHFAFWLMFPALTIYLLANYIFREYSNKYIYVFFIVLFYSLNLYRVIMFGDAAHMSIYAAGPLVLLFIMKALDQKKNYFKYATFIALSSLIASGAGANPPMYAVFLLPPIIYIFVLLVESIFRKNFISSIYAVIKFSVLTIIATLLVNIYWIIPFLYQYIGTVTSSSLSGANLLDWSLGVSGVTSITNIIRMQGAWDWYSGVGTDPYVPYAANYQNNPILLLLGFLLPILAFAALYFVTNRYTIFFTLITLVGIIFSQGSHPPFGPIYNFLTQHVPLFWMFRSSWYKFSFLVALGYSYLGAVSVAYIFDYFVKQKRNFFNIKLGYIFLAFIIIGTLIYAYPFIDGEKFPKSNARKILPASHVKVPEYVYKSADWINSQKETFRTFVLPNIPAFIYKWDFNGLTDVFFYLSDKGELYTSDQVGTVGRKGDIGDIISQIFNGVYYNNFDKALKLSGVLSSKYLIERDDIRYNFYGGYDSPKFVNNQLGSIQGLNYAIKFGEWNFYKLADKYFLPLFYIPENLIYSESDTSSLGEILTLSDLPRQQVLFSDFTNNRSNVNIKPLINSYVVKANCVLCSNNDLAEIENKIQIPFVQLLPDSPFYFLVSQKEQKLFNQYKNLLPQRIDVDLAFASKRLAELSRILDRQNKDTSEILIKSAIQKYKNFMEDALLQTNNLSESLNNEYKIKILAYIKVHKQFLESLNNFNKIPQISLIDLSNFINNVFEKLKSSIWMTTGDTNKRLIFNLDNDGIYNVILKNSPIYPSQILIDNKEYVASQEIQLTKGTHKVELIYPQPENLLGGDDASPNGSFTLDYGEKKTFVIKDFDYKNTYSINFEYKVLEGKINILLIQDNDQEDWNGNIVRKVNSVLNNNGKWHTFKYTLTPNLGAKSATLEFYSFGFDSQSSFMIRNFTINNSFVPQFYLVKAANPEYKSVPYITFTKINPTLYRVHVKNAQKPFILNFGENYDKGWKAYVVENQKSKIRNQGDNIVASYFDDQIKELESENKFIDNNFFSIVFSTPVSEKNHLKTNGYANGWFIDKNGDYDIIIEYWPQRLFYFGLVISGIAVIASTIFLILNCYNKNEEN